MRSLYFNCKSLIWIPAFAGMTNLEAIHAHIQDNLRVGSTQNGAPHFVIPAKAGIQIKSFLSDQCNLVKKFCGTYFPRQDIELVSYPNVCEVASPSDKNKHESFYACIIKSFGWIPASAGMTRCGALFPIETIRKLVWCFERIFPQFVIPAKAGIQIKLFDTMNMHHA